MSDPADRTDASPEAQGAPGGVGVSTLGLGGFVVELLLPTALAGGCLLLGARYLPFWNLRGRAGIWTFGLLLLLLSFVLSVWIDSRTLARRRQDGKRRLLNRADARSRLVKFVLGGIVVPLGLFVASNLVTLPDRRTPMSVAADLAARPPETSREEQIGSVVLRARRSAVKVAGIAALETSRSQGALDQLFRILADDPAAARGGTESRALSKALASYGKLATPRLLERLAGAGRGVPAPSPSGPDDFDLYVGPGFDALRSDVAARSLDPARKAEALALLQGTADEARQRLATALPAQPGEDRRPGVASLALDALLSMSPGEADAALPFARKTAADEACEAGLRGQALLLVARLGGKEDLDLLYRQLAGPDPLLQARALQAIATLNGRSLPEAGKGADRAAP